MEKAIQTSSIGLQFSLDIHKIKTLKPVSAKLKKKKKMHPPKPTLSNVCTSQRENASTEKEG